MVHTYKKPETRIVKIELQQMVAQSPIPNVKDGDAVSPGMSRGFDFFMEEEEEVPGKSDDEDWEDWEEEEDP
jgi:hypothetical protein